MNKANKIIFWSTRIFLVLLFIATIIAMQYNLINVFVKKDYIGVFTSTVVIMFLTFVPNILHKLKLDVSNLLYFLYLLVVVSSLLMGGIFRFYKLIPVWDSILHLITPIFWGMIGFAFINVFNGKKSAFTLTPFFAMFYVFLFAMTCGMVWEVYEFTIDIITKSNMQRYMTMDGVVKIGQDALFDTMKDLVLNTIGSIIVCLWTYVGVKRGHQSFKNLEIKWRSADAKPALAKEEEIFE